MDTSESYEKDFLLKILFIYMFTGIFFNLYTTYKFLKIFFLLLTASESENCFYKVDTHL